MPNPLNYLNAFQGPDAAQIDRSRATNALLNNQVQRIPQMNRQQDQEIQAADQSMQMRGQVMSQQQRQNAAGIAASMALAVARSPKPKITAQQLFSNPDFQKAVTFLGMQPPTIDQADTDESLRSGATTFARALGVKVPETFTDEQGPGGSLLQRSNATNELKSVVGREPGQASQPRQPVYRPLSPDELRAYGLPEGTTAQIETQSGKVDLINRPTSATIGRPVPPAVAKGIIENRTSVGKIDRALEAVRLRPQSFGAANYWGDAIRQRTDSEGVDARAKVADIGSLIIHDRSGAAVSASEFPRLRPFIPAATDTDKTIITKLENLKANIQSMQDETESIYSQEAGYKQMEPSQPQGGAAPEGTVVTSQDGRSLVKRNGQWVPQ